MDTYVRPSVPRGKKPAQVPADCVPSTGYVPMSPMMPGEPEAPGTVGESPGQPAGPPLDHPFTGPVAEGPGPDTMSTPAPAVGQTPGGQIVAGDRPATPVHTVHAAVPAPDSAARHPAYAVTPPAPDSAGVAAVPPHAVVPAPDSAAVPAVPGPVSERLVTPAEHQVLATTAPDDNLTRPLGQTLTTARADTVPDSSGDRHDGCGGHCTGDGKTAQPDSAHAQDPGHQGDPSMQQSPDTGPLGKGSPGAAPDSTAANTYSPDPGGSRQVPDTAGTSSPPASGTGPGVQHAVGTHDSPVRVATAPAAQNSAQAAPGTPENPLAAQPRPTTPVVTPQSQDPPKPFYKSERPQQTQAGARGATATSPVTPGADPQQTQAGTFVPKITSPVTPGVVPQQNLARKVVEPATPAPATPGNSPATTATGLGQAGSGSGDTGSGSAGPVSGPGDTATEPGQAGSGSGDTGSGSAGTGSGSAGTGSGSGDTGSGSAGTGSGSGDTGSGSAGTGSGSGGQNDKKGLPPIKATSGGGNLTFDEGQYRKLTGVVNDMDDSLTKNAARTPTTALDTDLTLRAGNTVWGPAGDVANWAKNFGQSVAEINEKTRVALSLLGNALTLATMIFKDTDNLAQTDFTTFVTQFPDLNTGGGETNPGAYGAYGGGSTGGKN